MQDVCCRICKNIVVELPPLHIRDHLSKLTLDLRILVTLMTGWREVATLVGLRAVMLGLRTLLTLVTDWRVVTTLVGLRAAMLGLRILVTVVTLAVDWRGVAIVVNRRSVVWRILSVCWQIVEVDWRLKLSTSVVMVDWRPVVTTSLVICSRVLVLVEVDCEQH